MKAIVQRVRYARVEVNNEIVGAINQGLLVFVGFGSEDTNPALANFRDKVLGLRIFPNEAGRFDKSVRDVNGGVLLISQFTLYGDCSKGRRPDLFAALEPDKAEPLYDELIVSFREAHSPIETGVFGAHMNVSLENDGPVTFELQM